MLDRESCERRVYRLATLLTGNPNAAANVISQVVDAQPDLQNLDGAHMDRVTVLRSREIAPSTLVSDRISQLLAKAVAGLTPQQREAWIFSRVYRAPDRETARAMDCSVTATQRHLEQADAAIAFSLGEHAKAAPKSLLAYSMSLDVPRFYRVEQIRRKHMRVVLLAFGLILAALLIGAFAMWWSRPLEGS